MRNSRSLSGRSPVPTTPTPSPSSPWTRSSFRARSALLPLLAATVLAGCAGGTTVRPDGSVASTEKSQWVFPLYRYSRKEGRKTFYPLMVIPISLAADEPDHDDGWSSRPESGGDRPAWSDDGTRSPTVARDESSSVEPGVWDASLPPSGSTAADPGLASAGGLQHRVAKGDTLYGLARRYYGDGKAWTRIAEANRDIVQSPERIPVGTSLRIP